MRSTSKQSAKQPESAKRVLASLKRKKRRRREAAKEREARACESEKREAQKLRSAVAARPPHVKGKKNSRNITIFTEDDEYGMYDQC